LQITAPQDLKRYRSEQDKALNSYGWVDPDAGIVRIPVTHAMEILLQKGFPARSNGQVVGKERQVPPTAPPAGSSQVAPAPVGTKERP
jgi:hypothetical protein